MNMSEPNHYVMTWKMVNEDISFFRDSAQLYFMCVCVFSKLLLLLLYSLVFYHSFIGRIFAYRCMFLNSNKCIFMDIFILTTPNCVLCLRVSNTVVILVLFPSKHILKEITKRTNVNLLSRKRNINLSHPSRLNSNLFTPPLDQDLDTDMKPTEI